MGVAVGTRLGPYEIVASVGAGGMGEVYRARDIRLNRTVAVKILPEYLSSDPGRRARFEREARTISRLSHPNICALYDLGDHDGTHYVVLEYLEGATLADRLAKGPLPLSEVLAVGVDIASALEAAHRNGIVHRDLKPANVILTKAGAKLLDFGIAKPSAALASAAAVDASTLSESLTEEGGIVGTFRYMAPEQLEGREADGRTDIFALGALLYEAATGRTAFEGASRASLISAIMSSDPAPISTLRPMFPLVLDYVVQTCLAKEPDERWQSAHDIRLQLDWIREQGAQAVAPRESSQHQATRERTVWASATFLLLILATAFAMRSVRLVSQPQPKIMFAVEAPPGYQMKDDGPLALSPDGTRIAYAAVDAKGKQSLWIRPLDSGASSRLEESASSRDYYSFVWTPDGKAIIAPLDGRLVRLSVSGGANEVLCDKFDGEASTINRQGMILAWTAPPTTVFSVSAEDCTPHPRSPSGGPGADVVYGYPYFLPDDNHFLFAAIRRDKHRDILLGSLNDASTRVVVRNGSYPKYVSDGYILFSRDGYMMAQKFDVKSLQSSSEPFLVFPHQLSFYATFGWAAFDAASNGVISGREQVVVPICCVGTAGQARY